MKKAKGVAMDGRADGGSVWWRKGVVVFKRHKLGKNSTTVWWPGGDGGWAARWGWVEKTKRGRKR